MKAPSLPTTPPAATTTRGHRSKTAILLLLLWPLWLLAGCQARPVGPSVPPPLATQPAPVPTATPDVQAVQAAIPATAAPLADAQVQAQSLPPALPQRAIIIADLSKVGDGLNAIAAAVEKLATTVQAQDAARSQDAAWHTEVTQQYATLAQQNTGLADQLAASKAQRVKDKAEYDSQFQKFLWWAEVFVALAGAGLAAFLLVYFHNLPGGLTAAAVTGAMIFSLRMLGWIDEHKLQIFLGLVAAGLAYELAWLLYFKLVKGMAWADALAATFKTWLPAPLIVLPQPGAPNAATP